MSEDKTIRSVIQNWMRTGGDLSDSLMDLSPFSIEEAADAETVCLALKGLSYPPPGASDRDDAMGSIYELAACMQSVETPEAMEVCLAGGLPELVRIFHEAIDAGLTDDDTNTILFVLKQIVAYQADGVADLLAYATSNIPHEGYLWSVVFKALTDDHPAWREVCDRLAAEPLNDFLAVAFLDFVNTKAIAGLLTDHPFDNPDGVEKVRGWLCDSDPENYSYAHSATAALPFLRDGERDALMAIAMEHASEDVRMEAAWALARVGEPSGVRALKDYCCDARTSSIACAYMNELGLGDDIPDAARDPDFEALAEMHEWLAHPQELGRAPDRIDLLDKRELLWPPMNEQRSVWLFHYEYDATEAEQEPISGVGMVGTITFALFGESTDQMAPQDVYGLHCCWEMEMQAESDTPPNRTPAVGRAILRQHNPDQGF